MPKDSDSKIVNLAVFQEEKKLERPSSSMKEEIIKSFPPRVLEEKHVLYDLTSKLTQADNSLSMKAVLYYELLQKCDELVQANTFDQDILEMRTRALKFLEQVLDVKDRLQIDVLMEEKQRYQGHTEYLPGKNPHLTKLPKPGEIPNLERRRWLMAAELSLALKRKKLLSLSEEGRLKDEREHPVMFHLEQERDPYRAVIRAGLFYDRCPDDTFKLTDTSESKSKGKEGYKSFVVNVQGEISLFEHDTRTIFHSSFNNGKMVLGAGEAKFEYGKLVELTDSSGHYKPNAQNMYQTLKYFESQGVDISRVIVSLMEKIPGKVPVKTVKKENLSHYYYRATQVYDVEKVKEKANEHKSVLHTEYVQMIKDNLKFMVDVMLKDLATYQHERRGIRGLFSQNRLRLAGNYFTQLDNLKNKIDSIDINHSDVLEFVRHHHDEFYGIHQQLKADAKDLGVGKKKGKFTTYLNKWELEIGKPKTPIFIAFAKQITKSKDVIGQIKNSLKDVNPDEAKTTLMGLDEAKQLLDQTTINPLDISKHVDELENLHKDLLALQKDVAKYLQDSLSSTPKKSSSPLQVKQDDDKEGEGEGVPVIQTEEHNSGLHL